MVRRLTEKSEGVTDDAGGGAPPVPISSADSIRVNRNLFYGRSGKLEHLRRYQVD